jgi:SAM-dependent methyltransferase
VITTLTGLTGGGTCQSRHRNCSALSTTDGSANRATRWTSAAGWEPKPRTCPGSAGGWWASTCVGTAARLNPGPGYLRADLLRLPLQSSAFDAVLDRGCFHYLAVRDRARYAAEVARVLRRGGKLLLRPSLRAGAVRNDIDEQVIRSVFARWEREQITLMHYDSDCDLIAEITGQRMRQVAPGGTVP